VPVVVVGLCLDDGVVEKHCAGGIRCTVARRVDALLRDCEVHRCIERAALAGLYGFITGDVILVLEKSAWC
jgi:hypothetical protein